MDIKDIVQRRYSSMVKNSSSKGLVDCCKEQHSCCSYKSQNSNGSIPSFGVGAPVAHATIKEGEIVLDVGSGTGGDCLKAARHVGASGKVMGLDITDEMLKIARENVKNEGLKNVEFVKGDAESIPFDKDTFDVVISDCVINLVPDKEQVFCEIYRVLKDHGRMIVSDVISNVDFPEELKRDENLWCGCVSGAMVYEEYIDSMYKAGFTSVEVLEKRSAGETQEIQLFHGTFRAIK